MKRNTLMLAGAGLIVSLAPHPASAQNHDDPLLQSQREGVAVIRRGIEALGGFERLRGLRTVQLDAQIGNQALGQARQPGGVGTGASARSRQTRDLASGALLYELFPPGTEGEPVARLVYTDDEIAVHRLRDNTIQRVDRAFAESFLRQEPYVPGLLLEAASRARTVRSLGAFVLDGTRYDAVTFATVDGEQHTLLFEASSGLLRRSRFVESHAQFGDHVTEVRYDQYQEVAGIRFPHRIEKWTGDREAGLVEYTTIAVNVPFDASLLELPADASEGPPMGVTTPGGEDMTVESLGDGIYLLPNVSPGYNTMFVVLDDYVIVLEASVSPDVGSAVIEKIREVVPDKPIRYAAITHYHFDHSGGLGPYISEGVAIVTTEGNREFVRDVGHATRTLEGDTRPAEPTIETVQERRIFGSGARRVEFYQVGPDSHVDELLIAYLPAQRLMFVADAYSFNGEVRAASPDGVSLAEAVERLGLEIEIVVPVHGQRTTGENFWESVRMAREALRAQAVRHSTPEVSPDGQQILFVLNDGEQSDILVVNRDGTNITRLTETPNRNEHSARWSPEGDRVVYVARGDTENALFVLHLSTNTSSKVVEGSGIQTPSWSPDGLSIVYAAGAFPQLDIYSRDLTRSVPDRISREGGFIHTPLVSPDGSRIAFVAARLPADSGPRIYVMNADGSAEHPVSSSEWLAERPAWSPDGDWIAFQALSRPRNGGARTATLRIVRPDGTDGRAVAAHDRPFLDESPSWFPDGRRIAFQSDRNGEMRIYVLDIDDGSVRQVTR